MDLSVAKLIPQPPVGRSPSPRDKVRPLAEVAAACEQARRAGQTVVQAHGTFDLLHLGHVRHLEAARKLGDLLVVTVTADRFVNKGPGGAGSDAGSAIYHIRPSIYIKGKDYQNPHGDITGKITLEREAVEAHGGCIHFTD